MMVLFLLVLRVVWILQMVGIKNYNWQSDRLAVRQVDGIAIF